ncbi:MAG TPA: hypothetical protein GXZ40_04270 [Bacteroidales bacterium]|nr:hypothetical protein [Bacteroidales bacterium]
MESPQGRKPLGTRRQKSELVSSFCRLASPRLVSADLEPGADPERNEGARPRENYDYYSINDN